MEIFFRFMVQHPLLPLAILLVSVLVGLLLLQRKLEPFPGEGGLGIADEPEDAGARSFDEPRLNTHLQYAAQSLDSAEKELRELNFGLVSIRISNYFVTLQSLTETEKASIERRGEELAKKFHQMAQEAIKLRDQHFPPNREIPT